MEQRIGHSELLDSLSILNPRQREAVLHQGSPLLILAGAGSGKTRVITTKIAYLIGERGLDPQSVLAVTFTNRAAEEMKARAREMVPQADKVMIRTFHSFGAWLLRRHTSLMNLSERFSIYDDDDSLALLKNACPEGYPRDELKATARAISRAKDRNLTPSDDLTDFAEYEGLKRLYSLYQEKLQESGNVDFGDLIMLSVRLLAEHKEVRQRIQQRLPVILVDEYQDANTAQFMLLKQLYNKSSYLCVVGDEDQSIYRFRGAEVENIINFPKEFPGTKIIRLEQNYRSTKSILEAALRVVENNEQRLGKDLWTENPQGEGIGMAVLAREEEEARFCASLLTDRNYGETAILFRNNYQSRSFEMVFSRMGIPYRLVGSLRFAAR